MINLVRMRQLIGKTSNWYFAISRAEASAYGGAITLSDMPKGTSAGDKLQRDVIRLVEVKQAYAEAIEQLEQMRRELTPLIDQLQDIDERAVMRLRYLMGHRPQDIANSDCVGMSRRTVYRYLRTAENRIMNKVGTGWHRLPLHDT